MRKNPHKGSLPRFSFADLHPVVLLVDADIESNKNSARALQENGCRVIGASSGTEALDLAKGTLNCIVLDTDLPDMSGIELAVRLRELSPAPIVFVSAFSSDEQLVKVFQAGDDFMVKPYNPKEFVLRISMHIRRVSELQSVHHITLPPLSIDVERRMASIEGRQIHMTPKEFIILSLLAKAPNQVVTFSQMFTKVWDAVGAYNRHAIVVNICSLRKKLTGVLPGYCFIRTEWGEGYSLAYPPQRIL